MIKKIRVNLVLQKLTEKQMSDINTVLAKDGITFQVGTDEPQIVRMLFGVCDIINNAGGQVTPENIRSFFQAVNAQPPEEDKTSNEEIDALIKCLVDASRCWLSYRT